MKPISPLYFNDKERSSALLSISSILNILLPDSQPNQNIYKSFEEFINSINLDNWVILYIFLELNLIKDLGYDPNLEKFKIINQKLIYKKLKLIHLCYDVPLIFNYKIKFQIIFQKI